MWVVDVENVKKLGELEAVFWPVHLKCGGVLHSSFVVLNGSARVVYLADQEATHKCPPECEYTPMGATPKECPVRAVTEDHA